MEDIKRRLQRLSSAGVSDNTIARLCGVSLNVIRGILLRADYTPTPRIVGKIYRNLNEFLSDLQK